MMVAAPMVGCPLGHCIEACGGPDPVCEADPDSPGCREPCRQAVILQGGPPLRPRTTARITFNVYAQGRLDVFVDWTIPGSLVGVWIARGDCPIGDPLALVDCDLLFQWPPAAVPKPRRLVVAEVPPRQYQLIVGNASPHDESVTAQVVLNTGSCPPTTAP